MIKTFTVKEQSQLKANITLLDGAQYLVATSRPRHLMCQLVFHFGVMTPSL